MKFKKKKRKGTNTFVKNETKQICIDFSFFFKVIRINIFLFFLFSFILN
jgi:hypothetical protein